MGGSLERVKIKNNGQFKKGDPRRHNGRPVGSRNKSTIVLQTCILEAAELSGYDGYGEGGATGYFQHLADDYPELYGRLVEKYIPQQIQGRVELQTTQRYETKEEVLEAFRQRGLQPPPRLIDITPNKIKEDVDE